MVTWNSGRTAPFSLRLLFVSLVAVVLVTSSSVPAVAEEAFDVVEELEYVEEVPAEQPAEQGEPQEGKQDPQRANNGEAAQQALANSAEPRLSEATAAAIIDKGGNILYERNSEQEKSPASITKVMTAVVALSSGKSLDDEVICVAPYLGEEAQMAGFEVGDRISFRDLLRVMLVYSANDAAYNVALHVGGSIQGFADLMNAKAAEIGMTHSHFMNPHGIDEDGHYSSAIDLARLSRYALENFPFIAQTVAMHSVEVPVHGEKVRFQSTDELLATYEGIRGVKTGYAENYTFMGASTRGGISLYSAVLGCTTASGRFNDTAAMMDWAYAKYQTRPISQDRWAVRVHPLALDFDYQTVVSATGNDLGLVWPNGSGASYSSTLVKSGRLLDTSKAYGWTQWYQGEALMGQSMYSTRPNPVKVSSWPTFSMPLFYETATLGRPTNA